MKRFALLTSLFSVVLFGGCGGGGSSGPAAQDAAVVTSTNTFNFQSGWQKFVAGSYTKTFTVSGSCNGTLSYLHSAASQPTSFYYSDLTFPHPAGNVNPGYYVSNQQQIKTELPGCVTSSSSTLTAAYYDASTYAPWGYIGGTAYNGATSYKSTFREFSTKVVLPNSVKVGDSGVVGTLLLYGTYNFSKDGIVQGKTDVTYSVEPDTATTALVNIVSKVYDGNNKLTLIDQSKYRIDAGNNVTYALIDQQYSDTLTLHLVAK